jgi:hypothetical protein
MDKWVQLCLKAEIHVIQEKLVRFRERADRANASADIPENIIRNHFEMLQVLERYKGIPTVTDLLKIFPEAAKYVNEDNADIQYALGRVAVESEEYPAARLFGLNLLFEIINDPERAERLRLYNGFDGHQFIYLTGQHDVFVVMWRQFLKQKLINNLKSILMK